MVKFPTINNIKDLLPAIQDRPEFVVAGKEGYIVVNYNVMFEDTFLDPEEFGVSEKESFHRYLLREARGIIFDSKTGNIIRRPFFKFFNINEREETQLHNLDFSKEHWVDIKLDGSMIAVFAHEGNLVWGTKMVAPDFHDMVGKFVESSDVDYAGFCWKLINDGYTPIFEFMHPQKRIVIDYGKPALTLLAIRNMITGEFVSLNIPSVTKFNIPVVEQHSKITDPKSFMEYVHELKNAEGFVIRWADGHRVKIKAHEYIQIHKAKEAILQDRNIVELILDEKLDDIKAHLPIEDRDRLDQFEDDFNKSVVGIVQTIVEAHVHLKISGIDRKTFALSEANKFDRYVRPILFSIFDDDYMPNLYPMVRNTIRNNLTKTVKYEEIRDVWFRGIVFNG